MDGKIYGTHVFCLKKTGTKLTLSFATLKLEYGCCIHHIPITYICIYPLRKKISQFMFPTRLDVLPLPIEMYV